MAFHLINPEAFAELAANFRAAEQDYAKARAAYIDAQNTLKEADRHVHQCRDALQDLINQAAGTRVQR